MTDSPSLYPVLRYRDAAAAIDFLTQAFGFTVVQDHREGDRVVHAELRHDNGLVMVSTETDDERFGPHAGQGWVYVVVDDADAHHERARAAGANIIRPLEDQDYGSRDYSARDPEGNIWSFGTYRPSLEPSS